MKLSRLTKTQLIEIINKEYISECQLKQKGFYELRHPDPIFRVYHFDSRDSRTVIFITIYSDLGIQFYDLRLKEIVKLYNLKVLDEKFKLKYLGTDPKVIPEEGERNERRKNNG